jgi:hypothetical protein
MSARLTRLCQPGSIELPSAPNPRPPTGIPGSDPQGRDVTVVDLVQLGIALLLLGLDLGDVGTQSCPVGLDDLPGPGITAQTQVGPLEHETVVSHPRSPTIHGVPVIHAVF